MLRPGGLRRVLPLRGLFRGSGRPVEAVQGSQHGIQTVPARRRRSRVKKLLAVTLGCAGIGAALFPIRHHFTAQAADLSRAVIGDENTARLESWYFRAEDRANQWRYRLFGGPADPFATIAVDVRFIPVASSSVLIWIGEAPLAPVRPMTPDLIHQPVMVPPVTRPLRSQLEAGEGAWTTIGLPRSSPEDILMAKTFIRPDPSRPYAQVGVLLIDSRRVRLHVVGGTGEPGGFRGVRGPGMVAPDHLSTLLAAWTGGFKGPHGNYGMYADGKEYVPLRNGLASAVVYKDGRFAVGQWGRDFSWSDDIEAVRQNAVLMVDGGAVSPRTKEGNDTWGYVQVNSAEFITWRSAIGQTADGHLLVAAGPSLSADTLAKALWAAGAHVAMQLDINSPYVLTGLYFPQPDGTNRSEKFMSAMPDNPARFLKQHERDLMYVTFDESRFWQIRNFAPLIGQ